MTHLAEKEYWDQVWQPTELPRPVKPERSELRNHSYGEFHRYFSTIMRPRPGQKLIEFGCAQSIWLSYFARHFGLDVTGIDYSERGCRKAEALLSRDGTRGKIVHADFMVPPAALLGAFDYGISFGVAEHFADTGECLMAFGRFVKPGGLLITMVPNFVGFAGTMQRLLAREVYDIHFPMDSRALADAHRNAGFDVIDCRYIVCANFGVVTLGVGTRSVQHIKRLIRLSLMGLSASAWIIDRSLLRLPATRFFSPYIICAARKPTAPDAAD